MNLSILSWLPYIIIASVSGCINLIFAWKKLKQECVLLIEFKPLKSFGCWFWFLIEFTFPALLCWFLLAFSGKPEINFILIGKAIALSVSFFTAISIDIKISKLSINLKSVYNSFIRVAYDLIINEARVSNTEYLEDIKQELYRCKKKQLKNGIHYLESYCQTNIFESQKVKGKRQEQLEIIKNISLAVTF